MLNPDTTAATFGGFELCYADLGDTRLKTRAAALVNALVNHPGQSVPAAIADTAAIKAAYYFFENQAVDEAAIRQGHRLHTIERARPLPRILILQDTTDVDYGRHPATTGLGPLSAPTHHGFRLHTALAVSVESVPLGVLHQVLWVRDPDTQGKAKQRRSRAQDEKESKRWAETFTASLLDLPSQLETVTIGDREADIYQLFATPRPANAFLLIRGTHNRAVTDESDSEVGYLWGVIRKTEPDPEKLTVTIPRGHAGKTREAILTLRWTTVTLHAPHGQAGQLPGIQVVLVEEEKPPAGVEPICWLLLTTLPVDTREDALTCVAYYKCRWLIERYHYVLKSGCTLEKLQLKDLEPLKRALALYVIVAWRILSLTYLGRSEPDAPATRVFTREELAVAGAAVTHHACAAGETPTLRTALRWVARLGGFLGRKSDGDPGVKVLWRGLRRLADLVEGTRIARMINSPQTEARFVGNA
jgi:hypothetical protein